MIFRWHCNKYCAEELKDRLTQLQSAGYLITKCRNTYIKAQKGVLKPYGLVIKPNVEENKNGACIGSVELWLIQYYATPGVFLGDLSAFWKAKNKMKSETILQAAVSLLWIIFIGVSQYTPPALWVVIMCFAALIILLSIWRMYRLWMAKPYRTANTGDGFVRK